MIALNSTSILLFLNLSGGEVAIVFLFILIFFGAESIPSIARSFGKVMYQIKNATDDIKKDIRESTDNIKKDILDQTESLDPISDIKNEFNGESGVKNPIKNIKSDIDNTIKDINL